MASLISITKKVYNINNTHIDRVERTERVITKFGEEHTVARINVYARPYRREQCRCPKCGRKFRGYYDHKSDKEVEWRMPGMNGVPMYILYNPGRVECPEHGVVTERIPWADVKGHFTPDFNNEVAWSALNTTKLATSILYGINWRTVGNCMEIAHGRLEPDVSQRLHAGLRRICVDETSYKKGHKYITVVYDLDTNQVVWIHEDHGDDVFEKFCLELTPEERLRIEVVAGDGAGWIDRMVKRHFPNASRCIDFFHAVQWANKALDDMRTSLASRARKEYEAREKEYRQACDDLAATLRKIDEARAELESMPKAGRPSARKRELRAFLECAEAVDAMDSKSRGIDGSRLSDEHKSALKELREKRDLLKGSKYALVHNPENRKESQDEQVRLIQNSYPDLYRGFQLKEALRIILHMTDADLAAQKLDDWIKEADGSGSVQMKKLAKKVSGHKEGILNAIRLQANSARSESTNTTIKAMIKLAYGFWNIDNLKALIYLKCSVIVIPLNNRPQMSAEARALKRERDAAYRKKRKEEALTA